MLAVDFLEFLRRRFRVLAVVHQIQALIVELVRRLLLEGVVLRHELVPQRAGAAAAERQAEHGDAAKHPKPPCERQGSKIAQFKRHTLCRHPSKIRTCDVRPRGRPSALEPRCFSPASVYPKKTPRPTGYAAISPGLRRREAPRSRHSGAPPADPRKGAVRRWRARNP